MGRNSRDDYQWLVDELLAVEEEEQEVPAEEEEIPWWHEEGEPQNTGWSYGLYEDEEFDASAAVEAPTKRELRRRKKFEKQQRKEQKKHRKKKRKRIFRLLLMAVLEIAGILAIIGWWIEWLT